jgi:hypothetical protein
MAFMLYTTKKAQAAEYGFAGGRGWGFGGFFQQMCPDDSRPTKIYGLHRIQQKDSCTSEMVVLICQPK